MRAGKALDATMYLHMLVKVGFLSEGEFAARDRANVRSFTCVDAKVVKEVVPFAEMFVAVFVVAFKHFNASFGLGVLESEDSELFGSRDMLLYLHRS